MSKEMAALFDMELNECGISHNDNEDNYLNDDFDEDEDAIIMDHEVFRFTSFY
jgi:hypothetical protein